MVEPLLHESAWSRYDCIFPVHPDAVPMITEPSAEIPVACEVKWSMSWCSWIAV